MGNAVEYDFIVAKYPNHFTAAGKRFKEHTVVKSEKDYYQILGIRRDASFEEVRNAYRMYAAKFHPDKHHGDLFFEERFREIKEAYEILSDNEKRWRYDIRKFGKSKVAQRPDPAEIDGEFIAETRSEPKRKLMIDVSHIEIYITLFYFTNLAAWVMYNRMNANASSGGHIWSLFLCGVSTMMMWRFVTGVIELLHGKYSGRKMALTGYLFLALGAGYVPLGTSWIP